MGDFFLILILLLAAGLALRSVLCGREKGCGGNCGCCGGSCCRKHTGEHRSCHSRRD